MSHVLGSWLCVIIAVAVLCALVGAMITRQQRLPRRRHWLFCTWVLLSAVRVGALWIISIVEWNHASSLAYVPLIVMLYPEASILQPAGPISLGGAILLSSALLAGSFVLACATVAIGAIILLLLKAIEKWITSQG
jgi:hypothetical protein